MAFSTPNHDTNVALDSGFGCRAADRALGVAFGVPTPIFRPQVHDRPPLNVETRGPGQSRPPKAPKGSLDGPEPGPATLENEARQGFLRARRQVGADPGSAEHALAQRDGAALAVVRRRGQLRGRRRVRGGRGRVWAPPRGATTRRARGRTPRRRAPGRCGRRRGGLNREPGDDGLGRRLLFSGCAGVRVRHCRGGQVERQHVLDQLVGAVIEPRARFDRRHEGFLLGDRHNVDGFQRGLLHHDVDDTGRGRDVRHRHTRHRRARHPD